MPELVKRMEEYSSDDSSYLPELVRRMEECSSSMLCGIPPSHGPSFSSMVDRVQLASW